MRWRSLKIPLMVGVLWAGGPLGWGAEFQVVRNVTYLEPGQPEKLDLYLPTHLSEGARTPAVVWMHGNKHDKGDERERNVGETLAAAGYVCISINYGTWPETYDKPEAWARVKQNVANAQAAVRFLRKHAAEYHLDPSRIAAAGGSAGASLALTLGSASELPETDELRAHDGVSSRVTAVIDFYGGLMPALKERMTAKYPPTFIAQGKEDPLVNYQVSVGLAQTFAAKGVPHEIVLLEKVGHGFDLTTWKGKPLPQDLRRAVLTFLRKYLGPPADDREAQAH